MDLNSTQKYDIDICQRPLETSVQAMETRID